MNNDAVKQWRGGVFALLSAAAFAFNLVLAAVSYQFGANTHSLNLARAATFLFCLLLLILIRNQSTVMPLANRMACFRIGIFLCIEMYAVLAALKLIPVALAVLVFYTYPLFIAVYRWLTGSERFSAMQCLLLLVVLGGLAMVLIDSQLSSNLLGIGLALTAAIAMAAMLIVSEESLQQFDNNIVLLHALITVTVIIFLLSISVVDLEWPISPIGWLYFAGSSIFYVVATMLLFMAVALIGPLKTAVIDNTSPVWAIGFGYIFLQQSLGNQQIVGAIVVVIAIMIMQISTRQK